MIAVLKVAFQFQSGKMSTSSRRFNRRRGKGMHLTEEIINNHPQGTRKKYSDEGGLYLDIKPSGTATWTLRKMVNGTREILVIGYYPEISIEEARKRSKLQSERLTRNSINVRQNELSIDAVPSEEDLRGEKKEKISEGVKREKKKKEEVGSAYKEIRTFYDVYCEYMNIKIEPTLSKTYCESVHSRAVTYLLPAIGKMRLDDITPKMILETVRKIEALGRLDTAKRVLGLAREIFKFARSCCYFQGANPASDLSGGLASRPVKHMSRLENLDDIGRLLYAVSNYRPFFLRHAIKIQAHTFVRASELRFAQWSEINFAKAEWKIPAERMKMPTPHIVPLSRQVLSEFRVLRDITGETRHVFRSTMKPHEDSPFSEAAVLVALKSCLKTIGLPEDSMVGHGWRSVASTVLNESNLFRPDVIERQLAHLERNKTRASYNYAHYIPERQEMMQWYSDFLDDLEEKQRSISISNKDMLYYLFAQRRKEME